MKKLLIALLVIGGLVVAGCGSKQEATTESDESISVSQSVTDSLSDMDTMDQAAGNVEGLSVVGEELNFPTANSLSPAFSPMNQSFTCDPPLNQNTSELRTCVYYSDDFPMGDDRKEVTVTIKGYFNSDIDNGQITYWKAEVTYKDETTSVVEIKEAEGYPEDNNLLTGWVEVSETRYYGEDDERKVTVSTILLNENDTLADDDNLIKKVDVYTEMKDGSYMDYTVEVTPAVKVDDKPDTIWVNTYAQWSDQSGGKLKSYSDSITLGVAPDSPDDWDKLKFDEIYELKRLVSKDGSVATSHAHLEDDVVEYYRKGFKGVESKGNVDLNTGEFEIVHNFPDTSAIVKIEATGVLPRFNDGEGELHRTIYFADGTTRSVDAKVSVDDGRRTINFVRSDGWRGKLVEVKKRLSRVLSGDVGNKLKGVRIAFRIERLVDSSAVITFKKDNITTPQSPDSDGKLYYYPDGSLEGSVRIYNRDGSVTVINVSVDAGKEAKFEIRKDGKKVIKKVNKL